MAKDAKYRWITTSLIILSVGCFSALTFSALFSSAEDLIPKTSSDFLAFWSSAQLMCAGLSPYSPQLLAEVQSTISSDPVKHLWNPPWALPLYAFSCALNFEQSFNLWVIINLLLIPIIGVILRPHTRLPLALCLFGGATLIFPIWLNLKLGQLGLVGALGVSLLFSSISAQKPLRSGLVSVLLTIKPHLFFLLSPLVLRWQRFNKFFLFLSGLILPTLLLTWLSLSMREDLFAEWRGVILESKAGYRAWNWQTISLPSTLRWVLDLLGYGYPIWPAMVIPLIGLLLTSLLAFARGRETFSLNNFSTIVLISITFAPYAWPYDCAALLPLHFAIIANIQDIYCTSERIKVIIILIILQILPFALLALGLRQLHYYFWFPLLEGLLLYYSHAIKMNHLQSPENSL